MRAGGHPATRIVKGAVGEQRRPPLPTRPSVRSLKLVELGPVCPTVRMLLEPTLYGLGDISQTRDLAVRAREVIGQRSVEQMPLVVPAHLRHAVGIEAVPARRQAEVAGHLFDARRS